MPATCPMDKPQKSPKERGAKKKGLRLLDVNPCAVECRRQDLNLHSHYRNQALNLARLPIPPLRLAQSRMHRLIADFAPVCMPTFFARHRVEGTAHRITMPARNPPGLFHSRR